MSPYACTLCLCTLHTQCVGGDTLKLIKEILRMTTDGLVVEIKTKAYFWQNNLKKVRRQTTFTKVKKC